MKMRWLGHRARQIRCPRNPPMNYLNQTIRHCPKKNFQNLCLAPGVRQHPSLDLQQPVRPGPPGIQFFLEPLKEKRKDQTTKIRFDLESEPGPFSRYDQSQPPETLPSVTPFLAAVLRAAFRCPIDPYKNQTRPTESPTPSSREAAEFEIAFFSNELVTSNCSPKNSSRASLRGPGENRRDPLEQKVLHPRRCVRPLPYEKPES